MVSDPKHPARARFAAIVACGAAALAGCGIKGPLKLPDATPASAATVAPANAPPRSDDPAAAKTR